MGERARILVLAGLSVAMFLVMPGRRQFAASHEARVGQTAREMAYAGWPWSARRVQVGRVHLVRRLGITRLSADPDAPPMHVNPWVVPLLSGEVRLQKPPLPYWCAAVLFKLLGVSEATCRLIPCVLGALATLLLYDLARLLYARRIAWIAALVFVTTFPVIEDYRLAMADPYLAFFTLLCVWAWVRASMPTRGRRDAVTGADADAGTRGRGDAAMGARGDVDARVCGDAETRVRKRIPASPRPRVSASFLILFYLSFALGALAKGPLILLHVFVPLALFHLCFGRRPPRGWVSHLVGVVVFAVIALPWPIAVMRAVPNARELWQYESVGELSGENLEGLRPWWFYLANLPYLALPWAGAWVLSIVYPIARKRWRTFFPLAWFGLIVLIFSLVGQKKYPYLLPAMPALALTIAVALAPTLRLATRWRMRHWPGAVIVVQVVIGIAGAIGVAVFAGGDWTDRAAAWVLSAVALALALLAGRQMLRVRPTRWFVAQTLAYVLMLLVYYNFVETAMNNDRSPKAVARELRPMADGNHVALLDSRMPEEVAFYLPLHPRQGPAPSEYLVVIDDGKGVRERAKRPGAPAPLPTAADFQGWFSDAHVTRVDRVPMNSAPGDARYKVYELTVERSGLARR